MPEYRVKWEIDIEADSPREAAEKALAIHRNPDSIATVFDIKEDKGKNPHRWGRTVHIDLTPQNEDELESAVSDVSNGGL